MKTLREIFKEYDYREDQTVDSALENYDSNVLFAECEVKTDKTLYEIFEEYKEKFGLDSVKLKIQVFSEEKDTFGIYSPKYKVVQIPFGEMTANTLNSLFHEMCHAIQHKENRLPKISESTLDEFVNSEIEAVLFARHHTLNFCPKFRDIHLACYAISYLKKWKARRLNNVQ